MARVKQLTWKREYAEVFRSVDLFLSVTSEGRQGSSGTALREYFLSDDSLADYKRCLISFVLLSASCERTLAEK